MEIVEAQNFLGVQIIMNKLSSFIQNINNFIQKHPINKSINELCSQLSNLTEADIFVADSAGRIISLENKRGLLNEIKEISGNFVFENSFNAQIQKIKERKFNLPFSFFNPKNIQKAEIITAVQPLLIGNKKIGVIFALKSEEKFSEEEILILQNCSIIISVLISFFQNEIITEDKRKLNTVKSAIGTLSFSELEAVIYIFDELEGNEGILIVSKVADKFKLTRSVIVNALRKLESAAVIESRSMGMKGTSIRVLNETVIDELNKLRS